MVISLLSACVPSPDRASDVPGADGASRATTTKVLTLATQIEPVLFNEELAGGGSPGGGREQPLQIAHNYLVVSNERNVIQPQLAAEVISVEQGTWRVNADGSMDTIWKLRPNVKWHDGTPFTSQDLLFSFNVYRDPDIPSGSGGGGGAALRLMQSAWAPDPYTFEIHWSGVFVRAPEASGLDPIARHLLEPTYATDKANFDRSSHFRTEFVGLGPYRLLKWEQGSHMEFGRFDDYYLGRPPLDRIIVRFYPDPNTLTASILAGAVDVAPRWVLDLDVATELRRRWEGTGNRAESVAGTTVRALEIQHRSEYSRPRNGLTDVNVRRALYQAIDRPALAGAMTYGLSPVADSWISPTDARRPQVESSIPQFPYDPAAAQRLIEQAGWVRGPDGVLAHRATGERFEIQTSARDPDYEKMHAIIGDYWKAIGAQVVLHTIPASLARDRGHLSTQPGVWGSDVNNVFFVTDRHHSNAITTAENRWTGANRGGYSNPRVDALLDRMVVIISPADRLPLERELLREQMGDLPVMALYWGVQVWAARAGVVGIKDGDTWNVVEWDLR